MPGRTTPIATGEIYHVFNRGIDHRPTFTTRLELRRATDVLTYYRCVSPPMRFSKFLQLSNEKRDIVTSNMVIKDEKLIDVLSYCLMPNHFHFLLRQLTDGGISKFIGNLQNSFTRYFNTIHQRVGPLFLDQFKAVRIETDEQLLHVSRYIHLNPYTSYIVKDFKALREYRWSSFNEYLGKTSGICEKETIFEYFKTPKAYEQFVFDQRDYQRKLDAIKHLLLEQPTY